MSLDIRSCRHVVISVPHSGTRTLQHHVTDTRFDAKTFDNIKRPGIINHLHWTLHPVLCQSFFELGKGRAYIPIRNPYDITDSWSRRYFNNDGDKTQEHLNYALGHQILMIRNHGDVIETFKMEDLPRTHGRGPKPESWASSPEAGPKSPRQAQLRSWVLANDFVSDFYHAYYSDDELWWL